MNILLINPPNCGRSIPEERYGIDSLKQVFRGEPLALEELAGNLLQHDVRIVDLKADPSGLNSMLSQFTPDIVGLTGVTCEANTMLKLASMVKNNCNPIIVVGGIHASINPEFFNSEVIDYIVVGLGKRNFAALVASIEAGNHDTFISSGVIRTNPRNTLEQTSYRCSNHDLVEEAPPAYHLVSNYRAHYVLEKLKINMGFVSSAFGCPYRCSFCCIKAQTGGGYLTKSIDNVIRDIELLDDIPVIRLVDANSFGNVTRAEKMAQALINSKLDKQYLADIRSDTVVQHPELLMQWKAAGLRAVIIGFEEMNDANLTAMNKANKASINLEAISILNDLEISIVGDFILSPEYEESDFDRLESYLNESSIDLPMLTVLTPLPGTPMYKQQRDKIINHNLDYYTLTNAVTKTTLEEKRFYTRYAELLKINHMNAKL